MVKNSARVFAHFMTLYGFVNVKFYDLQMNRQTISSKKMHIIKISTNIFKINLNKS